MTERCVRWEPVSDVVAPCAAAILHADPADTTVLLRFSRVRGAPARDLLVRFGRDVVACTSHDEFVHPWNAAASAPPPRLSGDWAAHAYPLLVVRGSRWLASFADGQILDAQRAGILHYRFVSRDNTVDVLTAGDASAAWVPAS